MATLHNLQLLFLYYRKLKFTLIISIDLRLFSLSSHQVRLSFKLIRMFISLYANKTNGQVFSYTCLL